jgi:hypothetical protein
MAKEIDRRQELYLVLFAGVLFAQKDIIPRFRTTCWQTFPERFRLFFACGNDPAEYLWSE